MDKQQIKIISLFSFLLISSLVIFLPIQEVTSVTFAGSVQASGGIGPYGTEDKKEDEGNSADAFIKKYGDSMAALANANDIYASVMIAQALISSDSGRSSLSQPPYYNIFAIKGRYNDLYVEKENEEASTTDKVILTEFRKYPDAEASMRDYIDLIKNGNDFDRDYYRQTWVSQTTSYQDATAALTGRFAMNSNYNEQLNNLISEYNLMFFDKDTHGTPVIDNSKKEIIRETIGEPSHYVSQENENLWDIAKHYNMTVGELIKRNHLQTSNLTYKQELFVE